MTLNAVPFQPDSQGSTIAAAGGTYAHNPRGCGRVRICNAGPDIAFVEFSDGSVAASLTSMAIMPGAIEVFSSRQTAISIFSLGSATLYITPGEGA